MKLSFAVLTYICWCGSVFAFTRPTPSTSFSVRRSSLLHADTQQDAFAAFADSLEQENTSTQVVEEVHVEWQERLEMLLDPQTPLAQRQILMSELLASNEEIRNSVSTALKDGKVSNKRIVCERIVVVLLSIF